MSNLEKMAALMRSDWNRRIGHDYRFWMSDGNSSDEVMWNAGARDFAILVGGIENTHKKTFLELGCGVGRLLKSALGEFKEVIGVDVADRAIEKARQLLGSHPNLTLHVGNGVDLGKIANGSVDVAASFAALTSMPADVIANYLRELHRVLVPTGVVRLQVYLGREQVTAWRDTLHIRCFERENFIRAVQAAGFEVEWIKELVLPFQVSAKELGIEALMVSLARTEVEPASAPQISRLLLPSGERDQSDETSVTDLETWMSANYARELVERGEIQKARETVEFATQCARTATIDISDLLQGIVQKIERSAPTSAFAGQSENRSAAWQGNAELFERNLRVLTDRFPAIAALVRRPAHPEDREQVEVYQTPDGPSIKLDGAALDHPTKPRSGGESWARRALGEAEAARALTLAVYGWGCGYHVEALARMTDKALAVIEPSIAVFERSLWNRDLTSVLARLKALVVGPEEKFELLQGEVHLLLRPQTLAVTSTYADRVKSAFYGQRGLTLLQPTIAVLGPFQGGTLPIANYTSRALAFLGQRMRHWDVSGFNPGIQQFSNFVKEKAHYDMLCGTYMEMVSQVILEAVNEKPIDILICMAQAPISGRVLTELRKRGVITVLWFMEDYLRFKYWKDMARFYDFVFTIQKGECVSQIRQAGAGEAHYLPMACDPGIHAPLQLSPEERLRWGSPVSFLGAGYHNRQQMFAQLAGLPFKIWGTEWPTCKPFDQLVQEAGRRLSPEEYVKIFNATDINLNLHSSTEKDGVEPYGDFVNPRTFELAAAGAFQLVDARSHLPELFEYGKELVTFTDVLDLQEKIRYYMARPVERQEIATRSRERALREHTYSHRVRQMLQVIYASRFEQLKRRAESSPWRKMLERSKIDGELHRRCEVAFRRGEEPILDAVVSDIIAGQGKLSDTEKKLLFLFHIRKQIIRMKTEEAGGAK